MREREAWGRGRAGAGPRSSCPRPRRWPPGPDARTGFPPEQCYHQCSSWSVSLLSYLSLCLFLSNFFSISLWRFYFPVFSFFFSCLSLYLFCVYLSLCLFLSNSVFSISPCRFYFPVLSFFFSFLSLITLHL